MPNFTMPNMLHSDGQEKAEQADKKGLREDALGALEAKGERTAEEVPGNRQLENVSRALVSPTCLISPE